MSVSAPIEVEDCTEWRNERGELHRVDGPAYENIRGYKGWYINGKLHRVDGPARDWNDGTKEWYV